MSHAINSPIVKQIETQLYNTPPYRYASLLCFPLISEGSTSPYAIIFRDMQDAPGCKWGVLTPNNALVAIGLIEMDDAIVVVANRFFSNF